MNKLPQTPSKPPPPSSSSLAPSASSLPPRPPPSQRNVISILPALPMAHHQKQKRKFPVQGTSRGGGTGGLQGHASLPPKPGIPGKPLPRDTGPIVLTGGKDNAVPGSFSYSHVAKRAYSSATAKTESPTATRREPVMTALAPASQLGATTPPIHNQEQPITAIITSSAEVITQPFPSQVVSLIDYGSELSDIGPQPENQISPQQKKADAEALVDKDPVADNSYTDFAYPTTSRSEMTTQHPNFLSFSHLAFYDNGHGNGFHPHRDFNNPNSHEASTSNGLVSDGYPPYLLPPPLPPPHSHPHQHYMHLQHQNQGQYHQAFIQNGHRDLYPFPNSMTPPNTGTLFAPPPPFQPHGVLDDSNQTSEIGSSTNPQTPFTPTHSFPAHLDLQHLHSQHSAFPPPPNRTAHFENLHQEQQQQNQVFESTLRASLDKKSKHPSVTESSALLHSISFFPPDNDQLRNEVVTGNDILPPHLPSSVGKMGYVPDNAKTHLEESDSLVGGSESSTSTPTAHRLQTYCLRHYLSDRFADVDLFVKKSGEGFKWSSERFSAHSFILSGSTKLAQLIEETMKGNEGRVSTNDEASEMKGRLSGSSLRTSWADEVENERRDGGPLFPITEITSSRKVTILLETSDKYLSRHSFLLTLRWLYGGEDWELDAYLDPSHPKHGTLEWSRENTQEIGKFETGPVGELYTDLQDKGHQKAIDESIDPVSLGNGIKEIKSEEVHMLERSIALLAAGTLLGVDEVIDKGVWGIRRWGMRFEGSAFERLLEFALEKYEEVDSHEALANGERGQKARYGVFKKHLLDEAIAFLVKSLPNSFKFDSRAPTSKYLMHLPESPCQSSTYISAPIVPVGKGLNKAESLRETYSTVLLSVPFSLLRAILEHDGFATRNGDWKGIARYDIAKAVVHERERRRKYSFKVARERRVSTCNELTEADPADEHGSDPGPVSVILGDKKRFESENLYWEESVICTFGHGGNGLEITRRKKGGNNGGRVLWKVGEAP